MRQNVFDKIEELDEPKANKNEKKAGVMKVLHSDVLFELQPFYRLSTH